MHQRSRFGRPELSMVIAGSDDSKITEEERSPLKPQPGIIAPVKRNIKKRSKFSPKEHSKASMTKIELKKLKSKKTLTNLDKANKIKMPSKKQLERVRSLIEDGFISTGSSSMDDSSS